MAMDDPSRDPVSHTPVLEIETRTISETSWRLQPPIVVIEIVAYRDRTPTSSAGPCRRRSSR